MVMCTVFLVTYQGSTLSLFSMIFIFFEVAGKYVWDMTPKICLSGTCTALFFVFKEELYTPLLIFKGMQNNPKRAGDLVYSILLLLSRKNEGHTKGET